MNLYSICVFKNGCLVYCHVYCLKLNKLKKMYKYNIMRYVFVTTYRWEKKSTTIYTIPLCFYIHKKNKTLHIKRIQTSVLDADTVKEEQESS